MMDVPGRQTTECVFWDFELRGGIGEWSSEGCHQSASVEGRTVCHCNHATNFAVLVVRLVILSIVNCKLCTVFARRNVFF